MIDVVLNRLMAGKPVLVAEIGVNYYDIAKSLGLSLIDAAKLMIAEAAAAGVHAVKFQSYKAETLAAKISPSYWDLNENPITSQRELFSHFDLFGEKEYRELSKYSEVKGVEFFSTAFDIAAADYLEPLMNIYKISSSDLSNIPFVEYQAKKDKPIVLSIGASNEDEIDLAVNVIRKYNQKPLTLLHCVLEYPTPLDETNLLKIQTLRERYPDCYIGYSDHTKPTPTAIVTNAAYLLGAQLIEKHFTLNKSLPGNDHFHSMDPDDARNIIDGFRVVSVLKGCGELKCLKGEEKSRINARRSLVSLCKIKKGQVITRDMLTSKRPGTGISPQKIDRVIGYRATEDIDEDVTITVDMVSSKSAG